MNSANIRNIYLKRAPLFYQVTVQYLRKQWIDFNSIQIHEYEFLVGALRNSPQITNSHNDAIIKFLFGYKNRPPTNPFAQVGKSVRSG